jgi:hypothetical protein
MVFVHFLSTNVISVAFFLRMYVKKAAETTFVRKKHAKNVDEIDGSIHSIFSDQAAVIAVVCGVLHLPAMKIWPSFILSMFM